MLWNAFLLAIREIRRNVLRSILTILGIVIGVASVIAMVMLGDGTTEQVTSSISKLGTNTLTISPGQERRGPPQAGQSAKAFTHEDVTAIKREIFGLKAIAPISSSSVTVVFGNANHATSIYGTDNDYFIVKDWDFDEGTTFTNSELKAGKSVCIIGQTVKEELFGEASPIGKNMRLGTFSCKIKGVLKEKGSSTFGMDQDDTVVVPIK
ncbi:MAG: ABC transporter permease, partial [Epsilonproteobacteria bacterium]|nr:ABC transporter permease [Campylobacterota bacterium]